MRDWDQHWMRRAYHNASMSTCLRRHVGAVAIRDRRSIADAFNGNIPGERHCDEGGCDRCADDTKRSGEDLSACVCVHAESNVVSFCATTAMSLRGATVFCTDHPCVHCVKLLASSGVIEIVYDREYPSPDWTRYLRRTTIRHLDEPSRKPIRPDVVSSALLDIGRSIAGIASPSNPPPDDPLYRGH